MGVERRSNRSRTVVVTTALVATGVHSPPMLFAAVSVGTSKSVVITNIIYALHASCRPFTLADYFSAEILTRHVDHNTQLSISY